MTHGVCHDFVGASVVGGYGLFTLITGLVQVVIFALLVAWQWRLRQKAQSSTFDEVGLALINTTYLHLLSVFGIALLFLGILNMSMGITPTLPSHSNYSILEGALGGMAVGFYHMVLVGIGLVLFSEGVGVASFRLAMVRGGVWGFIVAVIRCLGFLAEYWAPSDGVNTALVCMAVTEGIPTLGFAIVWLTPRSVFRQRRAVRFYSRFWTLFLPCQLVAYILMVESIDAGFCINLVVVWGVLGLVRPYIVYSALKRDSNYWQGLVDADLEAQQLQRHGSSNSLDVRTPLLGTHFEAPAAEALADRMDNLGKQCRIIHYASLKLGDGAQDPASLVLGAGGTARVFRGMYMGQDVAIKMLYCLTLTKETVLNFCQESAFLSSMRHPNIVQVEGICVSPPSICLVMELCSGSLFEFLRLDTAKQIRWDVRLSLAIDCASSIACLHGQKPPILHKDIKSNNFLIGERKIGKWGPNEIAVWLRTEGLAEFSQAFAGVHMSPRQGRKGLLQMTRAVRIYICIKTGKL